MKWLEKKNYYGSTIELIDYPFFKIIIIKDFTYRYKYYFESKYLRGKRFENLDDAKNYMLKFIYSNIKICDSFDEINNSFILKMVYETWSGNHRDNKDIGRVKYYNSVWLEGRRIINNGSYLEYGIRFDNTVSESYVKEHGLKVINRHIRRFKKEYESCGGMVNTNI